MEIHALKRRLRHLLLLVVSLSSPIVLAQPLIQLNTWPEFADLPIEIATGDALFVALSYFTDVPVPLHAAPLWQGEISYQNADSLTETALLTLPISAHLSSNSSAALNTLPGWTRHLQATTALQLANDSAQQPSRAMSWNLLITLVVIAVPGSIAWLNWAAVRSWQGYWRLLAGAPLVALGVWVSFISLSMLANSASHRTWPIGIFAWAMLTVVYLVVLMTAKRTFERAEQQKNPD